MPGLATGLLFVDLAPPTQIFPLVVPAGGSLDYQAGLAAGTGLLVQTIEFGSPTSGAFSNLLK